MFKASDVKELRDKTGRHKIEIDENILSKYGI